MKAVHQKRQERLPVRLLVQRPLTVRRSNRRTSPRFRIQFLDFCGHIEKAFRSKEKSIARALYASGDGQEPMQLGMRVAGPKSEISRAAFGIKSAGHRDGLQQCRFSGSVFSNEKRHSRMEF